MRPIESIVLLNIDCLADLDFLVIESVNDLDHLFVSQAEKRVRCLFVVWGEIVRNELCKIERLGTCCCIYFGGHCDVGGYGVVCGGIYDGLLALKWNRSHCDRLD